VPRIGFIEPYARLRQYFDLGIAAAGPIVLNVNPEAIFAALYQ
jgi:hypothetical protein